MIPSCIMKLKWTNSNIATSPIFDGRLFSTFFFHVIKSLIILIASFFRGYIMMLKLHKWSQEILYKSVIFKYKNYAPHLTFHVKLYFFVIHFFVNLKKNLVQTNFGFIVCNDLFNVNIEVISIQTLINIDRRKIGINFKELINWFI